MKLYFSNSGCSIEAEDFLRIVRLTHAEKAETIFDADIVIIHFCALSTEVITYIPPILRITDELKKHNPELKVFVGGCAEQIIDLEKRGNIDGTFRRGKMVEDLAKYLDYDYSNNNFPINYHGAVRIQMGCARNCGFCKKAYLDMPLISKPLENILADVKSAIADGFGDIELLAENSTEYGLDLNPRVSLLQLLKEICALEGLKFLTVSALCIDELALDDELVEYIRKNEKIRKVQIEAQTLIPTVRKKMCLSSSAEDVLRIMKAFEEKFIVTNVMTGYPGEIETDFKAQLRLIDSEDLYFIQVNQYDNTPYVPASNLKQVPKEISDLRLLELLRTINKVKSRKAKSLIGTEVDCVYTLEGKLEVLGHTAEVILKGLKHDKYFSGQSIRVRIKSFDDKITITNPYMNMQLEGVEV